MKKSEKFMGMVRADALLGLRRKVERAVLPPSPRLRGTGNALV